MSAFPLRYARRNVLIGPGGEAAALYRAAPVSYPFLPVAEKWALLHRLERNGLVDAIWGQSETGRRRKYYRLTPAGADELARHREQWQVVDRAMRGIWRLELT